MIAIRQLRYFLAVAETKSFSKAAAKINVTQPPISRQVSALEAELGIQLLDRASSGARLTAAGEVFAAGARTILETLDETCQNAQRVAQGNLGALSVGFIMHSAYTVLPGLTKGYMEMRPNVRLTLREGLPTYLREGVLDGRFDAVMLFGPVHGPGLLAKPIFSEPLCLAVPLDHPLARSPAVHASELEGVPLIASPMDVVPALRQTIEKFCRESGFEPTIALEAALQQTIVSLVSEGLGVALVPRSMHRFLGLSGVRFVDLVDAPFVDHELVWHADNSNPALASFVAFADKAAFLSGL
ncbi:putative LysR family transcriptional regulator [Sphingobium herbicidovorans NBRC 16415]|uniref:LysR family transcriptional regulator n=1 Tax=Sphingobium herbicidovorans (strain ATCC 700291 / DSM 11019 / CCUG 56400 / KCTC 2939 / LMG 18315 / NBRC 16415 / MH) TaxID=1219045 RepID=A0A086PBR2_SPHHM|nr:LysR family transcriptional regulator [Sphingobium herbicidovorans]KFG90830.1 putative LysR family transcriptional regulator [Sphingobium herbicidovorans NBRC 16415]